ncbi:cation-transporting P-type ATPase [Bacillus sp. DNRA2]|uniref:cation-translocating P-type ATPase n=1 Tax=Bacillus sp. DNRA2 TaxID=2723053 RepID=UPI00145D50AC|nr:cation-transporting P-type ATPase [Bacillus sp. DNRA2]NMD71071.1 cation-transporting P-type ATPase [Bacillus sp. DNRA2]
MSEIRERPKINSLKGNVLNAEQIISKLIPQQVFEELKTSPGGLSVEEARKRLLHYGKNTIKEKPGKPLYQQFLANFTSLMAILLWFSGGIAFIAKMPELGVAVWCVNLINGVFSFIQEYRAGKATEALKGMLASYARVIRDGKEAQIVTDELVPGDVILLEEGDKISADARLIKSSDLQINQSALTGESNPVRKFADAIYRDDLTGFETSNLIFTGSTVSSGSGQAVVIKTGMETEFGKIATLTQNVVHELSPLQKELNRLTKQISIIALGFGVAFFLLAIFLVKNPIAESFIFALGMIVAFIPEGLSPTVTLALAQGVQRMVKKNALVKNLSAVETLGCTSVICTDKTGTLTQNEMTVNHIWLPDKELEVTGTGYAPKGSILFQGEVISAESSTALRMILTAASLCSNARVIPPNEEHRTYTVLGDPTEACLGVVAEKAGIRADEIAKLFPRIRELHFDSRRKRMTTIHQLPEPVNGKNRVAYTKGAPKELIELCSSVFIDGKISPITDEMKQTALAANDEYARQGLRVLAVAVRYLGGDEQAVPASLSAYTPELIEEDMMFVGFVVMADPPRAEVAEAVAKAHKAGIRIVMITGDYGLTAESIAKRIGIVVGEHPRVISGIELENMTDEELKSALKGEVIFARVAPEQKYRVVENLQKMGEIVAVTGDGVNDAPALKRADIGVAMGISGTDVAKEAADMILTDDNFASIVHAVEQGRAVYNNIRKFLLYILNSNMPEAVPSAFFLVSKGAIPLPLTIMQILFVDLGTDLIPALGLGSEEPEKNIMNKPPRNLNEPLLNKRIILKAFCWYGVLASVVSMFAYFFVNYINGYSMGNLAKEGSDIYIIATTMTLAGIVFSQIGAVMNCRTENESVFKKGLWKNRTINLGIITEIIFLMIIMYVPILQSAFGTKPIQMKDWLFLICVPPIILAIEEFRKAISRKRARTM